jgi:signal transduction histidine kinase
VNKTGLNIIFILTLALALAGVKGYSISQNNDADVLIIFALEPSRPAYRMIYDGVRQKLSEKFDEQFNLHVEYLSINPSEDNSHLHPKFEVINKKYHEMVPDLLICVGTGIVAPVRQHAADYFLDLPNIIIDWDLPEYGYSFEQNLNDHTTVIGVKLDVGNTIRQAISLFPDYTELVFISGASIQDGFMHSAAMQSLERLDFDRSATFISNISMNKALKIVSNLSDSCILFIPSFDADSLGVTYYNYESVKLFRKTSKAPLFTITDIGFGEGALGGYVLSFRKLGLIAGQSAVKIIEGTPPETIIIGEEDLYARIFDWRELHRWNLEESVSLLEESTIMFKEPTFFERYRLTILLVIFFLILQSFLILSLIILYRRQRLMTRQLQASEDKLRELFQEDRILRLGQLTASLSHELNQPLTAILSTAQAGLRTLGSPDPDKEFLKEIFQNIVEDDKRTAAILGSIRAMMKLEKRDKEYVDLNFLIEEVVIIFKNDAIKHGITLMSEIIPEPIYILADRIQIQQVIINLISNSFHAMDFTKAGSKKIIITETVENGKVIISVRDFGTGIDDAIKKDLFKPFRTSRKDGMGIGLSISRSIIEDHGGEIWAENKPDGGAEFSFSLKNYTNERVRS